MNEILASGKGILLLHHLLGWPRSSFGFSHSILRKTQMNFNQWVPLHAQFLLAKDCPWPPSSSLCHLQYLPLRLGESGSSWSPAPVPRLTWVHWPSVCPLPLRDLSELSHYFSAAQTSPFLLFLPTQISVSHASPPDRPFQPSPQRPLPQAAFLIPHQMPSSPGSSST